MESDGIHYYIQAGPGRLLRRQLFNRDVKIALAGENKQGGYLVLRKGSAMALRLPCTSPHRPRRQADLSTGRTPSEPQDTEHKQLEELP